MPDFSIDPNPERRRHLALLFYKMMTNRVSLADLQKIPRKKIQQVAEMAYVKLKHGRLKESKEIFGILSRLDNLNPYHHAALGSIFQKQGKWVDAVAAYSQALAMDPAYMVCLVNRGEIYLKTKQFKQAAEDFRAAIIADPAGSNLWANRARSLVIALKRNLDLKKDQPKKPVRVK